MYEEIKQVVLYVRYSSANQTEQSIEGQVRVCSDFCQRHGFRIIEIYADRATSASKDIEKRVEFLRMIKDAEKKNFQAVIVYKLDRFARSRYDSANYKYRLRKNGVQLISATENISNDPEGIILESVLEGMAEFYSAELSQKITRGLKESAYKHNSIGGAIPLGYKSEGKKLVIDEETAPIVRQAFEMYAEGHSVADICRLFNARGYKTSKGTNFGKSSFSKMFHNERYIGVYQFHDYRAEDAIPAIIDKKLFYQVQARMKSSGKAPGQFKARHIYLLSGKLYCGHCGSKMNANSNGTAGYSYYECYGKKNLHKDCHKRNLRKDFIEDIVINDAMSLLTDENINQIAEVTIRTNLHDIEHCTDIPAIKDKLHETKLSLSNITKAIENGLAPETLVKRMVELEKDKKALEEELKKEEKKVSYLDKEQVIFWLNQFKNGDIEDEDFRRQLIDLFVNHVTVWDEDDNHFKVTIAYNLTSLHEKTYHLKRGGRLSDLSSMHRVFLPDHSQGTLPLLSRCSAVDLLIWQMRKNCSLFITSGMLSQLTGNTSICNTSKIDFRRLEALFCGVWPSPGFSLLSSRISLQNREKCRFEPTSKKARPARLSGRKSLISSGFRRVRGLQKRPQNGHPRHSCIKDSKSV